MDDATFLAELALRYVKALGPTAVTDQVTNLIESAQWDAIASLRCDPRSYPDAVSYYRDVCAVSFLRKCRSLPVQKTDLAANALAKWYDGEHQCRKTNLRLDPFLDSSRKVPYLDDETEERVRAFITRVRKVILDVIGHKPDDAALAGARFGPGSTFSTKARLATVADKITSVASLTSAFPWECVLDWISTSWGHVQCSRGFPDQVRGNRYSTAPKDATQHRSIGIEPDINIFYQLGHGALIRSHLKRAGIDITNGQTIHQRLARDASVHKTMCTIDLVNASECNARVLCELLLPRAWYQRLDKLRSPMTLVNGRWHRLEKFSSMGNGFTFELETLIFGAIASVASNGILGTDVFVYGDDIIVKDDSYQDVASALRFFGFEPNQRKTFFGECSFRESCGGDFFKGEDVTPLYLKDTPDGPRSLVALLNGFHRVRQRFALLGVDLPDRHCDFVRSFLPTQVRGLFGPPGLGDLVIASDDPTTWNMRVKDSIRQIRVVKAGSTRRVSWSHFAPDVVAACAAYGLRSGHPRGWTWTREGGITPRDSESGYKLGWACYS